MGGQGCGCDYTVCPHNWRGSPRDPGAPRLGGRGLDCQPGGRVRVVEHDDATRQPRPGGRVLAATVTRVTPAYVIVEYVDPLVGPEDQFWRETGWRAWGGMFTWRLSTGGQG